MGCKLQFDKPHPHHSAKKKWPKPTEGAPTSRSQGRFTATGARSPAPHCQSSSLLSRTPLGLDCHCPPLGPAGKGQPWHRLTYSLKSGLHWLPQGAYAYIEGLLCARPLRGTGLCSRQRMKREILETLAPGAAHRTHAVLVPAASRPRVLPLLNLKRRFQNQPRSLSCGLSPSQLTHSFYLHPRLGVP